MRGRTAEHVYVVDDEPKVRAVLCKTLERAHIVASGFGNADDCLARLAAGKCDLLITDVRMPGKDGIELLAEVRRLQPWLPILVVTGFGDVPMAVKAMKAGATDFIEKPLDREGFLDVVRTLLAGGVAQTTLRGCHLTRAEKKILYHILQGRNNKAIADILHRSHRTVEVHRRHLMQKMGANNIVELLRRAARVRPLDLGASAAADGPPAGNA